MKLTAQLTNLLRGLQDAVPEKVSDTNWTLQAFLLQVQNMSQLHAEADATQAHLEQRMIELQTKMLQLEQAAQRLNTPMNFDGNTTAILEPPARRKPVFSSIEMDARVGQLDGSAVLVYGGNQQTGEFLLVAVEDEHVSFTFKMSGEQQEPTRVDSNLRLCNNCWYHVQATRFRNEGMLTVTDLNTLAATSVQASDPQVTSTDLDLTSDLYVGGPPVGFQVANSGIYGRLVGCVANLEVNQEIKNLWTTGTPFPINGTPSCCQQPSTTTKVQPGVSFDGFGYLMFSNQNFSINGQLQVSFQFRTFNRHAVILLVEGEIEYYGLFLDEGHLVFQLENLGLNPGRENVTSDLTYNHGTWYEVTVSTLPGVSVSMVIRNVNSGSVVENKTAESHVVLTGGEVQIVLGSQHPNQTNSVGPTLVKFAGCLHDVRLNNRRVQLNTSSSSAAVSFQGCLPQVVPGVGFHGDSSFSQLAVPLDFNGAAEVGFQLKPRELNGVLLYAEDNTDTESFFYLALYNGHLFGVYQPAQGQAQVLRPSSSLLVDQQWHLVELNITAGSVSVQVDGNDGALSVLSVTLSSAHLYLAGVDPTLQEKVDRCEVCPVVASYTGGMQDVRVNGSELDFWDPATVLSQRGMYLSGLDPAQNATAPTLPPPSLTVAPPHCADPFQPTYSREGVNFGRHGNSFISYNLSSETMTNYFRTSFVLTCQFRAEATEGILYYSANNKRNPDNYLALYMHRGYLIAEMKTRQPANGDYHNLRVQTKFRDYADGNWWEVVILRIHNFLAIIVPERRDYVNNNQQSNTETFIDLTLPLYVGGTDIQAGHPVFPLPIKTGFGGCIRLLEISTARPADTVTFDLGSPDNQHGISQCYEAVRPGTAFNGTGFATMGIRSLESGLDVSVTFSTVQRSFLLLLLYQDPGNYFLIDAEDGRIRGHLRKNNVTTTIRTTHVETGYEICDGESHTVVFSANLVPRVEVLVLSIQLDQLPPNQVRQSGFDDISISGELHL